MRRPQSPQYVKYWGSLRPCLAATIGAPATRPVPPSPPTLARAASDTRRRLPEGRVRERVERLLQVVELARDEHEPLLTLGGAIEALELACDPVQPIEQGVELAISDVVLLHGPDSTDGSGGRLAF